MLSSTGLANRGSIRHYFVDEAGDPVLFSQRGQNVLVGKPGCSRFFIIGVLNIPDERKISTELNTLRYNLLNDPYFRSVPSMQSRARKTAQAFHAKDDLPEVRREVYSVIRKYPELKFQAVVKDKKAVLRYVQVHNAIDTDYRYHPNELYDYLVRRLFKNLLHKHDTYQIVFARRWNSTRTEALLAALQASRERFSDQWGITTDSTIEVVEKSLIQSTGLQVTDYFLWALQRFYEKMEERYLTYIWPSISLIQDIDDTHRNSYGEYYSQKNPLKLDVLEGRK